MKVSRVEIKNFRLLKDVSLDLEDDLSLIIGKNNCGKTSLLTLLDKFLGKKSNSPAFSFDDLNLASSRTITHFLEDREPLPEVFPFLGIRLLVYITYEDGDDLGNIGDTILMDLDPDNNTIVLSFEYCIEKSGLERANQDFSDGNTRRVAKGLVPQLALDFLVSNHKKYFTVFRKSHLYDMSTKQLVKEKFINLDKEKIRLDKILSFRTIGARREVSNKDSDKTLSAQSATAYERMSSANGEADAVEDFKDSLIQTDSILNDLYGELFGGILDDISRFGGIKPDETTLKIVSSLQSGRLLKDNTIVKYSSGEELHDLPESHNGLGYLNLISMIFDLAALMQEFGGNETTLPADINLLFIEEPEAHTHPQLQYIFIKNIKNLLRRYSRGGSAKHNFNLQTIISTHSAHIVSESDFDDIKYFRRISSGVEVLNLGDLAVLYQDDLRAFKFLKQYLTIHRSELFFADKAIFIEGDTERVILPAMITKLDQKILMEECKRDAVISIPLHSQNVSIVEVGNYFQTFEKFVRFIGLKSLVITDIDGVKMVPVLDDDGNPKLNADKTPKTKPSICKTNKACKSTNSALNKFFRADGDEDTPISFDELRKLSAEEKVFSSKEEGWKRNKDGNLKFAYQTEETNSQAVTYHARSFEDAFFHLNYDFLESHCCKGGTFKKDNIFSSLTPKHLKTYFIDKCAFSLAEHGVGSKPSLAIEVLLGSEDEEVTYIPHEKHELPEQKTTHYFVNWETPKYIEDGLAWLRTN